MRPLFLLRKGEALLGRDGLTLDVLSAEFKKAFPQEDPRYIDNVSKLAGIAASRAWEGGDEGLSGEFRKDFAVIVGSAFGAIDSTVDFDALALQKGPNAVNPMDFPNTVANAAGSRIGIWMQLKGPNVTLTNGGTSFLDALGFGLQGYNNGLFRQCFVGAVDKVPAFLKPLAAQDSMSPEFLEGSCLFLASGSAQGKALGQVTDYFSLQLKREAGLPVVFKRSFEQLWEDVEWIGCPKDMPLESYFPRGVIRYSPPPSLVEFGLGGRGSLEAFLAGQSSCGIVAAFSNPERKISFVKIKK